MEERLQKILAEAGVASRRKSEEIITAGRVSVNDKIITELGTKANLSRDKIQVDGKPLPKKERKSYILLNKPVGYLCTVEDTHGRPTVMDLIKDNPFRLYPVGRLDMDTSGLIILTNDGKFTHAILHPSCGVEKVYRAKVEGLLTSEDIMAMKNGIDVDGVTYKADKFRFLRRHGRTSTWEITLHEGKKRQIRIMLKAVKHNVITLERIRIGQLTTKDLRQGEYRFLKNSEVKELLKMSRPQQKKVQGKNVKRRGSRR